MSKEMIIIFVYDTQILEKDDNLTSAILYFHPTWVSDQQKTALCGQLMGTVHCMKNIFTAPKIVALQSGKFFIREYGRYLLAVGTDRNITDWLLEHRAITLSNLISFFHQNIEIMSQTYDNNSKVSAKLYHLFETYLKYLFLGGNIFSYIPSIKLPKSASNVFLEAMHILQTCQEYNYVLGGTLLYHNKVVATQLSSELTKRLVLTDPYRIKCPADSPTINFDLPLGVQLLQVYISNKEFNCLNEESAKCRNIFEYLNNKDYKKVCIIPSQTKSATKEPVLTAMKRDQSLIFTSVPEEESEHQIGVNITKSVINGSLQNRPKFLNLKNKTTDVENKRNCVIMPNTPSYLGQTSVCSTPMTELNKLVHQKAMSICLNPLITNNSKNNCIQSISPKKSSTCNNNNNNKSINKLSTYLNIVTNNLFDSKKFSSVFDVREKLKCVQKSITMKYYNLNLINQLNNIENSLEKPEMMEKIFKTITDPTFPVFKSDGTIVSRPFYDEYIINHLILVQTELKSERLHKNNNPNSTSTTHFDNFDMHLEDFVKNFAPITKSESNLEPIEIPTINNKKNSQETKRRSLTLPLKSLSIVSEQQESSLNHRRNSGVQLTPLMSKLSSFTFDERSSGFCSRDLTPMYTPTQSTFPFSFNKKQKNLKDQKNEIQDNDDESLRKCILFVCGQQDMVVILLLQEECCESEELINKLWELSTENLGKLEKQLHHCLDIYPSTNVQNETEPYSYLYWDSEWDTTQRGGPWGTAELGQLTYLHRDFKNKSNLTEILIRSFEDVIYGYQCGKSEIYYHQLASSNPGLPTPADPMGNVLLKAKRRLERDHSIILL